MEKKNQPEKSSSFSHKNQDTGTNTHTNTDTGTNTHTHTDTGTDNLLPVTESSKIVGEEKEGHEVTEIKEEIKEEETTNEDVEKDEKIQEIEEAPPEIQYTLESVSEDIDRFISTLLSSPPKDDDNNNENENENENISLEIPEFVDKFLVLVEDKIAKHNPEDEASFFESLDRVSKLLTSIQEFKSDTDRVPLIINRVGAIKQRAMSYLEDEFRLLLEEHSKTTETNLNTKVGNAKGNKATQDSESNNEECVNYPGYSHEIVSNLRKIANQLIKGGYEFECREVYMISRRNALEESLNQELGFEKLCIEEVQKMHWETLEREIPTWIGTFKDCATVYFPGEHKIAEEVFANTYNPLIATELFDKITRCLVIQLLSFAEAVAMTKRSTEKLFKVLDMYETLRDNSPAMDSLFPEETANELKKEATTARCRLGETAICIFCDLENSIKSDTGRTPVPGGAVHPLTRYTMNYLKYTCEYKVTLEQVFKEHSKIERADSTGRPHFEAEGRNCYDHNNNNRNNNENHSPFSNQMMRVMDLLDANLEVKAKLYKDIALSSIFMMNNGRYILQKIKGSAEIHQVMGDTWCRKRSAGLRNYHKNYQRETWGKLLGCLGHEGLNVHGKVVKPVLKERFKSFNAIFDEIHKTQSTWVVSDEQLQSELRVSISAVVIPAYRSFLGRFSQYLDPGRQTEKYIKFQPEDIETYIEELFDGRRP